MTTFDMRNRENFQDAVRTALRESLRDAMLATVPDFEDYQKTMIDAVDDIGGESPCSFVESFNDGYGAPSFDYAEELGIGLLELNEDNDDIEYIDYGASVVENTRRSVANEVAMGPQRAIRDWFEKNYDLDPLEEFEMFYDEQD